MARSRPPLLTPEHILSWIVYEGAPGNTADDLHQFLSKHRQRNFAANIKQNKLEHTTCYALFTQDLQHAKLNQLNAAAAQWTGAAFTTKNGLIPISDIIGLIIECLKICIEIIQNSSHCKKSSPNAMDGAIALIKQSNNNPFLNLPKVSLHGDFSGSNLKYVNFAKADLSAANFTNADLSNANLRGANLYGANLIGAQLDNADLRWANLEGASIDPNARVSLKSFLQTNYPVNFQPAIIFSINDVNKALDDIHDELEAEGYAEHNTLSRIKQGHDMSHYREIVAQNIVKLSHLIPDLSERRVFLQNAYEHFYFADHKSVRLANDFNSMIMHASHLFKQNKSVAIHPIANSAQKILLNNMKTCGAPVNEQTNINTLKIPR